MVIAVRYNFGLLKVIRSVCTNSPGIKLVRTVLMFKENIENQPSGANVLHITLKLALIKKPNTQKETKRRVANK